MGRNNDIKIFLSSNIKFLRIKKNITQKKIANECNKTEAAVSYWENGTREPNAVDIGILSNLFNVSVDDLILKDLRLEEDVEELKIFLLKNWELLTDDDKMYIKFIIEKRIKELEI